MKTDVHIIVSPDRLKENADHIALCKRPIVSAHFVVTDGDLANVGDFVERLGRVCRKCLRQLELIRAEPGEQRIYGAVDGQLVRNHESRDLSG